MRPLGLLEIGLRLGDSLVAAGAVPLASGFLLASLGVPSALLLLEILRGFARGLVVDLGRALRRLGLTPLGTFGAFLFRQVGRQLGVLGETAGRADRTPQHHARLRHRDGDDVRVVCFTRGALMEEVAAGAPGLQRRLHRRRRDGLVVEAQRRDVGLQFSRHRAARSACREQRRYAGGPARVPNPGRRSELRPAAEPLSRPV
ncbi:hypothetical protein EAS54_31515 [Bradyrhizobium guangzhouense]|nr:hypothetical protein EAS54_31515 [Bradyrhizobium guangzhouense]